MLGLPFPREFPDPDAAPDDEVLGFDACIDGTDRFDVSPVPLALPCTFTGEGACWRRCSDSCKFASDPEREGSEARREGGEHVPPRSAASRGCCAVHYAPFVSLTVPRAAASLSCVPSAIHRAWRVPLAFRPRPVSSHQTRTTGETEAPDAL